MGRKDLLPSFALRCKEKRHLFPFLNFYKPYEEGGLFRLGIEEY